MQLNIIDVFVMQNEIQIISERLSRIEEAFCKKEEERYIGSSEFCQMTGMSPNSFYQKRKKLSIKPYYFGRKLRFKRKDVIVWINNTISEEPFSL